MFKQHLSRNLQKAKKLGDICWTPKENCFFQRFAAASTLPSNAKKDYQAGKPKLGLRDFIAKSFEELQGKNLERVEEEVVPYLDPLSLRGDGRSVYFEIYGCQMNHNDVEVVWAVLQGAGYTKTNNVKEADIVFLVTCAIRDSAETKIWNKLREIRSLKCRRIQNGLPVPLKIAIIGCMAERLKEKVLEKERLVDLVAGPDSYKDLPRLLALTRANQKAVNVLLSLDETYADVMPVRLNQDSVTAYLSIMRGCDNMCSYCIVPFTRGRERSRPVDSILDEVRHLRDQGVKEITLLGQNVNSYRDITTMQYSVPDVSNSNKSSSDIPSLAKGFRTVYKPKKGGIRFAELLDRVSSIDPEIRIRFTSPHPKDFPDEVLQVIKERKNICKNVHLPAQSGNSVILERMRRGYTREAYLELVQHVKEVLPEVCLSGDFIMGFCGETEEQFEDTFSLLEAVQYRMVFAYPYSMREKTTAHRRYQDDVPDDVKHQRMVTAISLFRKIAHELNEADIGKQLVILIEGNSRRSDEQLVGKTDGNVKVVIPKREVSVAPHSDLLRPVKPGDYVCVQITEATSQGMRGSPLFHTTLHEYSNEDELALDRQRL